MNVRPRKGKPGFVNVDEQYCEPLSRALFRQLQQPRVFCYSSRGAAEKPRSPKQKTHEFVYESLGSTCDRVNSRNGHRPIARRGFSRKWTPRPVCDVHGGGDGGENLRSNLASQLCSVSRSGSFHSAMNTVVYANCRVIKLLYN